MKTRYVFFLLQFCFLSNIYAQHSLGEINGIVTDSDSGEALPFVNVSVDMDEQTVSTLSDFDGYFSTKKLPRGLYTLTFSYVGYYSKTIENVEVKPNKETTISIQLRTNSSLLDVVEVVSYKVPLIQSDKTITGYTIDCRSKINPPSRDVSNISGSTAGIYKESKNTDVRGERADVSKHYIDGIKTENSKLNCELSTKNEPEIELEIRSGLLTAGEINDFSKWEMWQDIAEEKLNQYQKKWSFFPSNRYTVQLSSTIGNPIADAKIRLLGKQNKIYWEARTDNTGSAELWLQLFENESNLSKQNLKIEVRYKKDKKIISTPKLFHEGVNFVKMEADCNVPQQADILFVVDATSSMSDEINYLKAELKSVITQIQNKKTDLSIRLGSVFYRDEGEEYLTKKSAFSSNINQTIQFIQSNRAKGGGDFEEAVEEALQVGIEEMAWRESATIRLLFLVLDAPPHSNPKVKSKLQRLTERAAEKGIKIIPITGSGTNKSTEYLMRSLALASNGTYTFLTDHSAIGEAHIVPTTDDYDMEFLNELLIRLIEQYTQVTQCEENPILTTAAKTETIQEETLTAINFYPNPVVDKLNVEFKTDIEALFIADLSGKILQRIDTFPNKQLSIDMSLYPSGIYFLRYLSIEGNERSAKLIINH